MQQHSCTQFVNCDEELQGAGFREGGAGSAEGVGDAGLRKREAANLVYIARATYDGQLTLPLWSPLLRAVAIHPGHSADGYEPAALVPTINS